MIDKEWVWDKWQQKILDHQGNLTIRTGRQVGKSEVISAKAVKFALENPGTTTLIIAAAQRQGSMIFEKVTDRISAEEKLTGKKFYKERPTKTKLILKNESRIYSVPAGRTGYSIRGYTIDLLIADEAAFIPEAVWTAVTPMLSTSKKMRGFGWTILLSTPVGKGGFFWLSFKRKDFKSFHMSAEKCSRTDKVHLKNEKKRMTKRQYRQEYLGEFTDDMSQFFSTKLIMKCATIINWNYKEHYNKEARYYLGVDLAGYGGDENAFDTAEMIGKNIRIVEVLTTERKSAPDTIGRIQKQNTFFNYKKIFTDDGGLGSSITDMLQARLGRKVMGLNNSSKRIIVNDPIKNRQVGQKGLHQEKEEAPRGIFKEDLYSNALMLMETGRLTFVNDKNLIRSLQSITFEYNEEGTIKISGTYAHLTEALVRACWCNKERGLAIFIR